MKNQLQPKFELLKDAYAIIDGVPEERIDLLNVYTEEPKLNDPSFCGTIACAGGWLQLHPKFAFLVRESNSTSLFMEYLGLGNGQFFSNMAVIFDISPKQSMDLFGMRLQSSYDDHILSNATEELSDKELWKARVRHFLKQKG